MWTHRSTAGAVNCIPAALQQCHASCSSSSSSSSSSPPVVDLDAVAQLAQHDAAVGVRPGQHLGDGRRAAAGVGGNEERLQSCHLGGHLLLGDLRWGGVVGLRWLALFDGMSCGQEQQQSSEKATCSSGT
jgi:hypothetical protein